MKKSDTLGIDPHPSAATTHAAPVARRVPDRARLAARAERRGADRLHRTGNMRGGVRGRSRPPRPLHGSATSSSARRASSSRRSRPRRSRGCCRSTAG
jgi:hypothetical protein